MKKLLVVDLCGTVVRRNTTHDFMRQCAPGPLRRMAVFFMLSRAGNFLFARINAELQRKWLVACLSGASQAELLRRGQEYARSALALYPRNEVLERIRSAQTQKQQVVLASASLDFIVSGFAEVLGVEAAVCSQLAYDDRQRCLGVISRDSTGRKLELLRGYIGEIDVEFDVITDNPEDSDLMAVANNVWFIHAQD